MRPALIAIAVTALAYVSNASASDMVLCFGEHEHVCKARYNFDEWVGCDHNLLMSAKLGRIACKAAGKGSPKLTTHSNQGGNKCGYMVIDVDCQ